jgi:arsenate reductase (thioredoxin)
MRRRYRPGVIGLLLPLAPFSLGAQQATVRPDSQVLFVCEHGTVKSLLAKLLFDEYAAQVGLHLQAVSRGTRADSAVPAWMQARLATEHLALGTWRPQTLTPQDLATASLVVSFDLSPAATVTARGPHARWDGLPSVSTQYADGRDAIKARVRQLVDSLKRASGPNKF